MQNHDAPVHAAIDIGSNTIHIVVARCLPDDLEILADEEELARIGESVTATGAISPQKRDEAITVLRKYKALAEQHDANPILVVATEAIRQASNSEAFLADVQRETGLEVHLISGDVEAVLTFYGATYEFYKETRESDEPDLVGVMDLGGGSTELVIAKHGQISWRTSLSIGSGWLHDRYLSSDPPALDDLAVARSFLQTYFRGIHIKRFPPMLIVTGGTANALLHLAHRAFDLDMQQSLLTYDDLIRCEGLLSAEASEEIAQRYQLAAKRARILAAGVLIIRTVMSSYQLDQIRVSPHGIREGALLAYTRHGEQWLQQVEQSRDATTPTSNDVQVDAGTDVMVQSEPFEQAGRRVLSEKANKVVEWRSDVLKHEDIEAVHKMRVASRRLRAVLDAYEPACDPRRFKKVYRSVKKLADILGKARDTDVMIMNLRSQLEQAPGEEQPGIQWLIDHLSDYRQQHQKKLDAFLKKFDSDSFVQQVESCLPQGGFQNGKS